MGERARILCVPRQGTYVQAVRCGQLSEWRVSSMAQRKQVQGMNDEREHDEIALTRLRDRLRDFASAREWNQFHSPKNLAIALSVEAGELLEHFQWLSDKESLTAPPS